MERMVWTDDRIDRSFELLREELHETRRELVAQMDERFRQMDERSRQMDDRFGQMDDRMSEGFREMRGELSSIRREMFAGAIALTGTWGAALAALVLHG
jgi:hypothetical protein